MAGSSAGSSDRQLQDLEQRKACRHVALKKLFTDLQRELDPLTLQTSRLEVAEPNEDGLSEVVVKRDLMIGQIEGHSWYHVAKNLIAYSESEGKYKNLKEILRNCLRRLRTLNSSKHILESFKIEPERGFINSRKVGAETGEELNWKEVNRALGDLISLLCIFSARIGYRFKKYFPVPHGSFSFIIALSDQRILPLFIDNEWSTYGVREFDAGIVAFLDCVNQINHEMRRTSPSNYQFPNEINDDKIIHTGVGIFTVRLQSTSIRIWSQAMEWLLEDMKYLLKWVYDYITKSKQNPPDSLETF